MNLLQERLAELLFRQSWNDAPEAAIPFNEIPTGLQGRYIKQADEIIELFVEAIKGIEFEVPKHYHEKINSAFVFPPCERFKGEFKADKNKTI